MRPDSRRSYVAYSYVPSARLPRSRSMSSLDDPLEQIASADRACSPRPRDRTRSHRRPRAASGRLLRVRRRREKQRDQHQRRFITPPPARRATLVPASPVVDKFQIIADRCAEIGECGARAERTRATNARAGDEQRHVLARVIRRDVGRIAAVIGGDEEEIVLAQRLEQRRAARRRTSPAPSRSRAASLRWPYFESKSTRFVKMKSAFDSRIEVDRLAHAVGVRLGADLRADADAVEDVGDLAEADHLASRPCARARRRSRRSGARRSPSGSRCA